MTNKAKNSQIEEYIKNLKGKKLYEQNKAVKLGFSKFEEYIADKISKQSSYPSSVSKTPKQQIKAANKIVSKQAKTCECC